MGDVDDVGGDRIGPRFTAGSLNRRLGSGVKGYSHGMRCALVEFNHYHDEVLPTFVWLLNQLDVKPDVYMVKRSARRRPFAGSEGLRYQARSVEAMDRLGGLALKLRRYDLAIVNSMEPPAVIERATRLAVPVLGVVHNTDLLLHDKAYRAFFTADDRRPLVLGQHIAEHVGASIGAPRWISHVVFGAQPKSPGEAARPTTFAVSGNVEFHRRNYDALLEAARALANEDIPFLIRIIGRSTSRDGKALRATVDSLGLGSRFEFSPGEIDHPTFFELVAECDFTLPLIDTSREVFRAYLETKLASSIPFAIGLGVPLVANAAVVGPYGIERTGPVYEDGGLTAAMRQAIASTQEQRSGWQQTLLTKRNAILEASLANLQVAISSLRSGAVR
jgi:glycosyltransferase involved in cell wall biosynthesis